MPSSVSTAAPAHISKKSDQQDDVPDTYPGVIIASGSFEIVNHFD
jgi:hypothetical protein